MNETQIQNIIDMNYRVLTLLGIAVSIIMDYKKLEVYHDDSYKCDWFIDAIQKVVYENKPIPTLP